LVITVYLTPLFMFVYYTRYILSKKAHALYEKPISFRSTSWETWVFVSSVIRLSNSIVHTDISIIYIYIVKCNDPHVKYNNIILITRCTYYYYYYYYCRTCTDVVVQFRRAFCFNRHEKVKNTVSVAVTR